MTQKTPLTYRDAGVDIDAGNALVDRIRPAVARTRRPEVLTDVGGFGGLFALPAGRYREPVLVAATDGVGTKLKLALETGNHAGVGIDLVAMCVNDLVVQGAEPLFFLDYYASGRLDVDVAAGVVASIAEGCVQAGAALIGGETAELPGMYHGDDYDLAGFSVGVVEREDILDGARVAAGDAILGLGSSGPHSNGFSLIRKVLEVTGAQLDQPLSGQTQNLGDALLAPTRIYVKPLLALLSALPVHALAHITGGGLLENLPRVMPAGLGAEIDPGTWPMPALFEWLRVAGGIESAEMFRTFNCGIGMAVIVPAGQAPEVMALLRDAGETVYRIGAVAEGAGVRIATT